MERRYLDLEEYLVRIDADIEYSKLCGNWERVKTLTEVKDMIDKTPHIDLPVKTIHSDTIMYRHTEERE